MAIDGGALHGSTVRAFGERGFRKWGSWRGISVWALYLERDHEMAKHQSMHGLVALLEKDMQRRVAKAYGGVAGSRFKHGTTEEDFSASRAEQALLVEPREDRSEMALQNLPSLPYPAYPAYPTCPTYPPSA
jgi:hypothetical protein